MSYAAIFFRDNEDWGCLFRGSAWFKYAKFNHVVKFLFKGLAMYVRDRISAMMHWLCSRFEVNVNLFMGIDS